MVFENQICDRCHRPTVTRIMSMFNLDMICPACKEDERKHPLYELACQKEREALQRGYGTFLASAGQLEITATSPIHNTTASFG